MGEPTATEIVQAAARVLMGTALDLIQADPHHWSERPCGTCRSISAIVGRPFGCELRRLQGEAQRTREREAAVLALNAAEPGS